MKRKPRRTCLLVQQWHGSSAEHAYFQVYCASLTPPVADTVVTVLQTASMSACDTKAPDRQATRGEPVQLVKTAKLPNGLEGVRVHEGA
jgi:hypothetical protein